MCFKFTLNSRFHVSSLDFSAEPKLWDAALPGSAQQQSAITAPPLLELLDLSDVLCFYCLCVFSSSQNSCSCQYSSGSPLRGECAPSPCVFLHQVHHFYPPSSQSACLTKLKAENNFIGLVFCFFLVFHYSPGNVQVCSFSHFTSFPHPFIQPFFSSLLSLQEL